ncbi:SDR family NAD(P)-dependent oxidoreductase [Jiella mangrovi]|uniref:SDR family oxidoreductase n=1 Tax=Jiella mangrovi TaxID=2821407 RepID=A0ABS4BLJ8_9HYPH|nr:SDR family oxidoreductase [Jiella mangrovi]MBP0617594.1 SDR family oxidoreductase [Jiella mangrovi]
MITGAAKGIGFATAQKFAREGAKLSICDYDETALKEASEMLKTSGATVESFVCDVREEAEVKTFFDETMKAYDRIDILVANAGVIPEATIEQASADLRDDTFAVDGKGMFLCGKFAAEIMTKQGSGSIVFLSSISAYGGQVGQAVYGPAKYVAAGLTKHFAIDLAPKGVRVNAVSPGTIDTPAVDKLSDDGIKKVVGMHPMGRMGRPEEIANGIAFLASDEASFITGADLPIDGGYLAQ